MRRVLFLLCLAMAGSATAKDKRPEANPDGRAVISFVITQDPAVYERSAFGEPPQIGIWLQHAETGEIRTVFVTQKTGTGKFDGKAGVPVALPAWVTAYRTESGRTDFPTARNPVVDAITGPTRAEAQLRAHVTVSKGSRWFYFVEVNVAGDYNHAFPHFHEDGQFDPDGNGQPSLVYRGEIVAHAGESGSPELVGRTEQLFFTNTVEADLTGITTARQLLRSIVVSCAD